MARCKSNPKSYGSMMASAVFFFVLKRCPNDFTHQVTKAHNHVIPRRSLQQCAAMRRRPQHHGQLWPVPGDKDSQPQLWAHTRAIHVRVCFRGREGPGRETERIAIYHRETQTERERVYEEHLPIYFYLSIHRSLYLSTVSLFLCVTMCTLICILNYTNMSTNMYIHTVDGRNPAPPWMVETLWIMG